MIAFLTQFVWGEAKFASDLAFGDQIICQNMYINVMTALTIVSEGLALNVLQIIKVVCVNSVAQMKMENLTKNAFVMAYH